MLHTQEMWYTGRFCGPTAKAPIARSACTTVVTAANEYVRADGRR